MIEKIKSFLIQSKRVWHILKKPTSAEFKMIAKVSAIGILALGAVLAYVPIGERPLRALAVVVAATSALA